MWLASAGEGVHGGTLMGADRKGKCVVRGGLGTHASSGEGNHIVGPHFNKSIDKDMDILYICIEYPSLLWGGGF